MSWLTRAVEWSGVAISLFSLTASPAFAQSPELDVLKVDATHHTLEFENDWVRVVRYVIAPHEKTPMHSHPALVAVVLTDVNAKATTPDGKTSEIHQKAGSVAWRGPVVHAVENVADQPWEGIVVEPKGPGNAAWTAPPRDLVKLDPARHKVEFENDQVRVERYWYDRGDKDAMHDHPTHVQIALTDANARLTAPDGKVTESHLKAGQVRYRPALSHAVENAGARFEGILVVLKSAPPAGK